MSTARSETLFQRAQRSIPGGVNSPVRAFRPPVRSRAGLCKLRLAASAAPTARSART
jgi:hypothetical protein